MSINSEQNTNLELAAGARKAQTIPEYYMNAAPLNTFSLWERIRISSHSQKRKQGLYQTAKRPVAGTKTARGPRPQRPIWSRYVRAPGSLLVPGAAGRGHRRTEGPWALHTQESGSESLQTQLRKPSQRMGPAAAWKQATSPCTGAV